MQRTYTIDGQPWKEFPDDTPDAVIEVQARQETQRRGAEAVGAGQRRDAARSRPPADVGGMGAVTGFEGYEPGLPTSALRMVAPTVGAALGMAGGGPFAPVTGAMGAAAGEGVNRLVGRIMQPQAQRPPVQEDLAAMGKEGAWSLAIPALARFPGRPLLRGLGRIWPGSPIAQQQRAVELMDTLGGNIKAKSTGAAGQDIENFMGSILGRQSQVPLTKTAQTTQAIKDEIAPLSGYLRTLGDEKAATTLEGIAGTGGAVNALPLDEFHTIMKRVGYLTANAPDAYAKSSRRLYGAMQKDLADLAASGDTQAQELIPILKQYGRSMTKQEIGDTAHMRGAGAPAADARYETANAGTIRNMLTRGKGAGGESLQERFNRLLPEEQHGILEDLNKISRYAQPGSGRLSRWLNPLAWGGGAAAGGFFGAGYPGLVIGGGMGVAIEKSLEELAKRPGGRAFILKMLENEAGRGPWSTMLGAGAGAVAGEPPSRPTLLRR